MQQGALQWLQNLQLLTAMDSPLAKYRAAKKLSLEAVATQFNVNKTTIMRWENGEVPIPVNRLGEIASVTGISRKKLRPDIFGVSA